MFAWFFVVLMLAAFAGVVRPYLRAVTRVQFALALLAAYIGLVASLVSLRHLAPALLTHILFAALAGIVWPYIRGTRRWQFAAASVLAFVGIGVTLPPPTPQELAARQAQKAREAAEVATQEHDEVVAKAAAGLEVPANYTRAEYDKTYARVGAATFAKLNKLEPGAVYAAAESRSCKRVNSAMVSDMSKPGAAVWFVDCADERRFMVDQQAAQQALARFETGKLALRDLEPSCTLSNIALCKASPAQRKAADKEIEYVSACDVLLQTFVVSPSSLDMHRWRYAMAAGDKIVVTRPFDSQNSFGAMIRGSYRCEIDARNDNVTSFSISGPTGTERII